MLQSIAGARGVWNTLLSLLPLDPIPNQDKVLSYSSGRKTVQLTYFVLLWFEASKIKTNYLGLHNILFHHRHGNMAVCNSLIAGHTMSTCYATTFVLIDIRSHFILSQFIFHNVVVRKSLEMVYW